MAYATSCEPLPQTTPYTKGGKQSFATAESGAASREERDFPRSCEGALRRRLEPTFIGQPGQIRLPRAQQRWRGNPTAVTACCSAAPNQRLIKHRGAAST
jgi:hypothetical protein